MQAPWADVKKEMTEEKGLAEASADKIGEYVKHKGKFVCASKSVRQFMSVVHHRWPGAAGETKERRAPHGKCTRKIGYRGDGHSVHVPRRVRRH